MFNLNLGIGTTDCAHDTGFPLPPKGWASTEVEATRSSLNLCNLRFFPSLFLFRRTQSRYRVAMYLTDLVAIIVAGFAAQGFDSFPCDDWNHYQCRHRVGPPPTKDCVENKSGK